MYQNYYLSGTGAAAQYNNGNFYCYEFTHTTPTTNTLIRGSYFGTYDLTTELNTWVSQNQDNNNTYKMWTTEANENGGMPVMMEYSDLQFSCGGTGTANDPYQICTREDMEMLANTITAGWNTSGYYFKVMNDISGITTPVGNSNRSFQGHFDGNGKTLTLNINDYNSNGYRGLFGYVGSGAEIENVITAGSVTSNSVYAGGIAARADGATIRNCENKANIYSYAYSVGGVVGYSYNTKITNTVNRGDVVSYNSYSSTGTPYGVGGIAGCSYYGSYGTTSAVDGCTNYGKVEATNNYCVGGIVGQLYYNGHITNSVNEGKVYGNYYVGGIVGLNYSGTSTTSTYDGCIRYCTNNQEANTS